MVSVEQRFQLVFGNLRQAKHDQRRHVPAGGHHAGQRLIGQEQPQRIVLPAVERKPVFDFQQANVDCGQIRAAAAAGRPPPDT